MTGAGRKASTGLCALFLLSVMPALAQEECRNAATERDMGACLARKTQGQGREMAAAIKTLRERYTEPSEKAFGPAMDKAQRAWIAWRDAECAFRNFESRQGTGYGNILATCVSDLNAERLKTLKDMVDSP
ncbi:MAG TPA: lysozyme inhibitor LprI family protein [Beijerinckiaceae bacterium]|nr:lysozyme inhibitor LprI family protein [Beijerinckiaceae bacterium]